MSSRQVQIHTSCTLALHNIPDLEYVETEDVNIIIPSFPNLVKKFLNIHKNDKKKMGISNLDNVYKITNHAMETRELYTINCPAFNMEEGGVCKNCLRTYKGSGHGYCHKKKHTKQICYYTKDNYNCSPICALGYLDTLRIDDPRERDVYSSLTIEMYKTLYPRKIISKSNDWRLLASGSCSIEDWNIEEYTFVYQVGVEIIPVKEEFLKKKRLTEK